MSPAGRPRRRLALLATLAIAAGVALRAATPFQLHCDAIDGDVQGHAWLVAGVEGRALQLDGVAAHLLVPAARVPALDGAFTVEGWVALGAYPFNDAPLLQEQSTPQDGWFLGVGDRGQGVFQVAAGGRRLRVVSPARLGLRQWAWIVGVFDPHRGASLYVNGEPAGVAEGGGPLNGGADADVRSGLNAFEMEQTAGVQPGRQRPTRILLDGIVDELAILPGARSAGDIAADYARLRPSAGPPLEPRHLPTVPSRATAFGAVYARLRYYKGWDDSWRVEGAPDVVVRFDRSPYWLTFWRGTSYIPHWVTENGIWYDNEFTETFPPGFIGTAEPMSDKQCRYSQVQILESSDARVVVHWRYAPVGVGYVPAYPDPLTGWADWTDEIHTIYPDGVGVRTIVAHSSQPDADREWHEGIVVMGPGMTPEQAIDPAAVSIGNSRGEHVDVTWANGQPPEHPSQPVHSGIQRINLKSRFRPFAIARSQDDPRVDVYVGAAEVRPGVSLFPWWNHWPTAFEPSNARYALAADRASHSSLTHLRWNAIDHTETSVTKVHLEGMTDGTMEDLARLARSWEHPAAMTIGSPGYTGAAYDPTERAWVVVAAPDATGPLDLTLAGSDQSPIDNIALVVKGWGDGDAALMLDGQPVARGDGFRIGRHRRLDGTDLIVFVELHSMRPVRLRLSNP